MLDLAVHIVRGKKGHFHPEKFEDHYETALRELVKKKAAGEKIEPVKHREPAKVINLMDALRRSLGRDTGRAEAKPRKAPARKAKAPARKRKAG
jgi:DNA end-binding protein Ku